MLNIALVLLIIYTAGPSLHPHCVQHMRCAIGAAELFALGVCPQATAVGCVWRLSGGLLWLVAGGEL